MPEPQVARVIRVRRRTTNRDATQATAPQQAQPPRPAWRHMLAPVCVLVWAYLCLALVAVWAKQAGMTAAEHPVPAFTVVLLAAVGLYRVACHVGLLVVRLATAVWRRVSTLRSA